MNLYVICGFLFIPLQRYHLRFTTTDDSPLTSFHQYQPCELMLASYQFRHLTMFEVESLCVVECWHNPYFISLTNSFLKGTTQYVGRIRGLLSTETLSLAETRAYQDTFTLGKQKMGVWTSVFMIGITLTSFSLLFRMSSFPQSTQYFLIDLITY